MNVNVARDSVDVQAKGGLAWEKSDGERGRLGSRL
jgi:hypothetical protein